LVEALLGSTAWTISSITAMSAGWADALYGAGRWRRATFDNPRDATEALSGGQSGSYVPEPSHPNHAPLMEGMHRLFEEHQVDGYVVLPTATEVYYGRLSS
jgi:hypothetical protein